MEENRDSGEITSNTGHMLGRFVGETSSGGVLIGSAVGLAERGLPPTYTSFGVTLGVIATGLAAVGWKEFHETRQQQEIANANVE